MFSTLRERNEPWDVWVWGDESCTQDWVNSGGHHQEKMMVSPWTGWEGTLLGPDPSGCRCLQAWLVSGYSLWQQ